MSRKSRLSKKKHKSRRRMRPSEAMMGLGAGLAAGGALTGALGYSGGSDLMGTGLGLAGAGVGVSILESVGEGIRKAR